MSTLCSFSPNTTAICSPQSNSTWIIGNSYNVTWDYKHPNYNNTEMIDIEVNYQTLQNLTKTYLLGFSQILKNASYFNIDITKNWILPSINSNEVTYSIYLLPTGVKSIGIDNKTLYKPVLFYVLPPNVTSDTPPAQVTPDTIVNTYHSESTGAGNSGTIVIAIFAAILGLFILLIFVFRKKIFKGRSSNFICIPAF